MFEIITKYPSGEVKRELAFSLKELDGLVSLKTQGVTTISGEGIHKKVILKKEKEGKVVFETLNGLMTIDLEDFIKQPAKGILYDLNKDRVTILSR
ncbi:unnamed protein product, partial [marine sediment metagenome]